MFKFNQWGINISLGIILTLMASINPVQAQSADNEGYQTNEKDTTYGDTPGGLNPLDIMHQAQQANRRSAAEFNAESQGQLDASVSDFKRLQQQRILEQQQLMKSQPSLVKE